MLGKITEMVLKPGSPTARLLRTSRLFSLPPPLPRPASELRTAPVARASDTATIDHPIHQAITVPQSSLARGDWGLKRNLPLRSSKSVVPALRVTAVDTWEHITDFDSAEDHTHTLQKWQELGVAMITERRTVSDSSPISAYESSLDHTDPAREDDEQGSGVDGRWKYAGPWLAGMTDGDFALYLKDVVRRKKPAFRNFLREHIKQRILSNRRQQSRDQGLTAGTVSAEDSTSDKVSETEYNDYIKLLRGHRTLTSELSVLIRKFLDLPPLIRSSSSRTSRRTLGMDAASFSESVTASDAGPPSTHPAAGLSYLRTNSYLSNHPVLGPQAQHPPIQARVLQPLQSAIGQVQNARLGVAGVVTKDVRVIKGYQPHREGQQDVQYLDIDTPGGAKVWVMVQRARINGAGRIEPIVIRADSEAVAIKKGNLPRQQVVDSSSQHVMPRKSYRFDQQLDSHKARASATASYASRLPSRPAQRTTDMSGRDGVQHALLAQLKQYTSSPTSRNDDG